MQGTRAVRKIGPKSRDCRLRRRSERENHTGQSAPATLRAFWTTQDGAADRGRESVGSPSLRTGQALFTHPALRLMGSNSETEVFEFSDSLWLYRPSCRAAVRLNSPASSKKGIRHRW